MNDDDFLDAIVSVEFGSYKTEVEIYQSYETSEYYLYYDGEQESKLYEDITDALYAAYSIAKANS